MRILYRILNNAVFFSLLFRSGAYYFFKQEEPLETQNREIARNKAMDIEDAMVYITKRMRYISYGDNITGYGKFNNCSVWIQDPFYVADQGL